MKAWFSVVGLVLDITGVLLLAREWFLSRKGELYKLMIKHQESKRRFPEETYDHLYDLWAKEAKVGKARFKSVVFGVLLLVGGFIFQLLGAWP